MSSGQAFLYIRLLLKLRVSTLNSLRSRAVEWRSSVRHTHKAPREPCDPAALWGSTLELSEDLTQGLSHTLSFIFTLYFLDCVLDLVFA